MAGRCACGDRWCSLRKDTKDTLLVLMDNLIATTETHVEAFGWFVSALKDADTDEDVPFDEVYARLKALAGIYRGLSDRIMDITGGL
jgi:hypothetical protein